MQVTFRLTRDELKQARHLLYYRLRSPTERLADYLWIAAVTFGVLGAIAIRLFGRYPHGWMHFPWFLFALLNVGGSKLAHASRIRR